MSDETLIYTTKGLVPFADLRVKDVVTMEDNARVTATEWRLGDEIVRRDVWVSVLRPLTAAAAPGVF
jgi:hypothetical protein